MSLIKKDCSKELKLKTHQLTKYTGAVKNFYGVIPGTGKAAIHRLAPSEESLSQAVVDIYSALKPRLAVMDGIVGMEGEGATNGTPADSKVIISGADCVSVDAVASEVIGFLHKDIMITRFAHERGLGVGMLDEIEVVGEKIKDVRLDFQKKCIKCYCCHELCPNGALELKTSFIGRQFMKRMNYKS